MIKAKTKFLILATTTILSIIVPLGFLSSSFANAASYSNVQVFIQCASSLPDYFTVSAFNMSGYMKASCQTQYPAASFELPNGEYIFTATADQSSHQIYYPLAPMIGQNVLANSSAIPYYEAPVVEYGYSVQQISSSTTLTISTQNVSSYPTTTLAIKVAYVNGTAAEGASVSASVIGSSYYWGYESTAVMWNTTQTDGTATLVTPQAPVRIDAWSWMPVSLPKNQTMIPVIVAGEDVNVTVYWQPTYVGLAGSATIVPPQTSTTITLHVQQSDYWVMPYGVQTTSPNEGQATSSSSSARDSIPATVYQQQQGNPLMKNYQSPTGPSSTMQTPQSTPNNGSGIFNGSTLPLIIVTFAALAVAAMSLVVTARIHRRNQGTKSNKTEEN
jgi:hypothetical protein